MRQYESRASSLFNYRFSERQMPCCSRQIAAKLRTSCANALLKFRGMKIASIALPGNTGARVKRSLFALTILGCLYAGANARDLGQWENVDPAIKQWYQALMQPDVPTASCCGEADAYFADDVHVRDGKTYVIVTDDRADEPRGRPHIEIGTEIEVPNHKLKWDKSNPTGHGVIFLSRNHYVFCYVQPGGV